MDTLSSTGRIPETAKSEVLFQVAEGYEREKEEVPEEVRRAALNSPLQGQKYPRKRRLSPRKLIQEKLESIDHSVCGPPSERVQIPRAVAELNEEFQGLFPDKMPPGLPPCRVTDHRIDFKPDYRIPAQRLYRLNPKRMNNCRNN